MRTTLCIAALLCLCGTLPGAEDTPLLTATRLPTDGRGTPDWRQATQVTGWRRPQDGGLARQQAFAQVGYDATRLLVRFRCPVADTKKLQGDVRDRDGAVWQDDAVELLLDPGRTTTHFYHFIINCRGSLYDARDGDPAWNGAWTAAAEIDAAASEWAVAISIPFATLERSAPQAGEVWGATFCLDSTLSSEQAGWAFTERTFEQPARFGRVVFQPDAPAIQMQGLRDLAVGPRSLEVRVVSRQAAEVTLSGRVASPECALLDQSLPIALAAAGEQTVALPFAAQPAGQYTAELQARDGAGTVLLRLQTPLTVRPPVMLSLRRFPTAGVVEATVDIEGVTGDTAGQQAEVTLVAADGREVDRQKVAAFRAGKGSAELHLGDALGKFTVRARILNAAGVAVASGEAAVERPGRPAWLGNTVGTAPALLPPFEPLVAEGERVSLWGRQVDFRGELFPASIVSQGEELLADRPALVLVSAGETTRLPCPASTRESTPAAITRTGEGRAAACRLRGEVSLEVDGCLKIAVELAPDAPLTVASLALEIPLRKDIAKLMHACRATWAETQSKAVPTAGWQSRFMPYLWVGDESRGLAWFTESDAVFQNQDPTRVLELVPQADRVVLRVRLLDGPRRLESPFALVFGLQPTPVKPVPAKKPHVWHGAHYGMESEVAVEPAALLVPAGGNLDPRRGTLEIVATLDVDPAQAATEKRNRTLFHLRQPNGDQVFLFFDHEGQGVWFYYGTGEGYPQTYPVHIATRNLGWKQGETHSVALTWGPKTVLYLDGKEAGVSAAHEGWMPGPLTDVSMAFGSDVPGDRSEWTLHACRVSARERPPEQLAAAAETFRTQGPGARLEADADTLYLHHPRLAAGRLNPPDRIAAGTVSVQGSVVARAAGVALAGSVGRTLLDQLKESGVDVVVFHDRWTNHFGYPSTPWGDKLHALVQACHQRQMRLLLYFGYGLGNLTPEMAQYHDEWTVWPLIPWYGGVPERCFDAGCNRSALPDFLLDGMAKLAAEYDIDGVYLDGTSEPFACVNYRHGCGYPRDDSWRPTYPVWANRDFMRRLCTVFHARRPDTLVDVHMSANLTIPTLAFADSYWDGEQFEGYQQGQKDPRSLLPLDSFRAEFMGRQFGLRPEFLVYEGRPFTTDEALAVTLLHDVLVRATGAGDKLQAMSAIWRAQDAFGIEAAEFLPYWSNASAVQTAPEGVFASLYRRAGQGALVVVSNLGKAPAEARVVFVPGQVGLPAGAATATDAIAGGPIAATGSTLTLPLGPLQWRLIRLAPATP